MQQKIVITGGPGTGKTTIAVNLALAFIKIHNFKVAIIDTDPQGSLGKWYMVRNDKGYSNKNLTFKKSGKLSQNEMDSALVDLTVLISNFY